MDDQTTMINGRTGNGRGVMSIVGSVAEFGDDIATLAELQAKLAATDLKETVEKATVPVVFLGVGVLLLMGAVPIVLIGLALTLAKLTTVPIAYAMLLVAILALAAACGIIVTAGLRARQSLTPFRRSTEELTRNLSWLRTVLVHSGRSFSRR
jgi:hypothetical protein